MGTLFRSQYRRHVNLAYGGLPETLGRNLIENIDIEVGGHVIRHTDPENLAIENQLLASDRFLSRLTDEEEHQLLLSSWSEVAGPLAFQLFGLRSSESSLFSLLDKDSIRAIVLLVYPKPTLVAEPPPPEKPFVPLQFWFNRGVAAPMYTPSLSGTFMHGDPGLAIPVVALEYGRRELNVRLTRSGDLMQRNYLNVDLGPLLMDHNQIAYEPMPDTSGYGEFAEDALPINDLFEYIWSSP